MQKILLTTLGLSFPVFASHPFQQPVEKDVAPNVDVTPVGRFDTKKGVHLFIAGEAILFQLAQDDLPYAIITDYNQSTATAGDHFNQTLHHYKQMWHWGMRLTAGYNLPHDGWDIVGVYTRFYTHNDHTLGPVSGNNYLLSTSQGTTVTDTTVSDTLVNFNWQVKFNEWDLEQGRNFYVSKFLRLRPLIGLRNLILGQEFTTHMQPLPGAAFLKNDSDIHFWGMGVLAGVNTYWNLNSNFSIFANAKLATLFGYFSAKNHDEIYSPGMLIKTQSGHQKTSKTGLDLALGVRWDKTFSDHIHFGVDAGFEQHTYYNMNKNMYGYLIGDQFDGLSGRDFSVQGFTFGMRLDF